MAWRVLSGSAAGRFGPLRKGQSMILDRNAFAAVDDVEYGYVPIPEAMKPGDTEVPEVRVRSLTGDQRTRVKIRAELDDKPGAPNGYWRALCCAMGMVDDKGAYLFPNAEAAAIELGKKHPELLERISAKILDMSIMTKASRDAAEKKSQQTTTNSGGTSSPEQSTPDTDSASTS
jgi:hypothetical protein